MLSAVAVAIKIQANPADLLRSAELGWHDLGGAVLTPAVIDANGTPLATVEAFEWVDVSLFGWGNTTNVTAQLAQQIKARGSALHAYRIYTRTDLNFGGVKAVRYRLLLLHSFVELAEWAVAILAIGFAAVIFLQYLTTGRAPALTDLQNLWGSAVGSVGAAAGTVASSATSTAIGWAVALGGVALAFGLLAKTAGVKAPRAPTSAIGLRAGPLTTRLGA